MAFEWPPCPHVHLFYNVYFALGRFSETSSEKSKEAESFIDTCNQSETKIKVLTSLQLDAGHMKYSTGHTNRKQFTRGHIKSWQSSEEM